MTPHEAVTRFNELKGRTLLTFADVREAEACAQAANSILGDKALAQVLSCLLLMVAQAADVEGLPASGLCDLLEGRKGAIRKARQQGRDEARIVMMTLLSELHHDGAKALSVELQNRILALEKL